MREALACNQRPSGRKIAVGEHLLKVTNQTHSVALSRTQMRTVTHRRAQTRSDALRRAYLLNAIEHPLRWQWQSDSLKVLTSSMRLSIHSICKIWLGSIGVYLAFLLPSSKQSMSLAT